jgi:hypothetical protein
MTVQLPLRLAARREPARHLADEHGISHEVIDKAVAGYAEDMLGDVFFELQEELERERDEAADIC